MNKLLSVLIAATFATVTFSAVAADAAMAPAAKPAMEKAAPAAKPAMEKAAPAAPKSVNPQHAKMKSCNKDAKTQALKGAERKAFMKNCLKKDA